MFPDTRYWDLWDMFRGFRSWISEILARVDLYCAKRGWQTAPSNVSTAMLIDSDRPEEKPRPPSGGTEITSHKPELVPILVALSE